MVQPSVEKSKRLLSHSIALSLAHTQCLTGAVKDPYDSDTLEQSVDIAWHATVAHCSPTRIYLVSQEDVCEIHAIQTDS